MARLLRVKAKAYELEQDDQTGIRCQSTDAVEQITTFSDCRAGIEAPRERTRERTKNKRKKKAPDCAGASHIFYHRSGARRCEPINTGNDPT
jgi:hypothetical protein